MFPVYSKLVYLDGIRVPIAGFSAAWSEEGSIQFTIRLMPSYEAEYIQPSTNVHIFHVEAGKQAKERITYEADPGQVGLLPFNQNYLKTDFVQDAADQTVGATLDPLRYAPDRIQTSDDYLIERMKHHGYIFLCAGVVDHTASSGSAREGQAVSLVCRGYDVDMDLVQLIQIIKGRGSLTDIERRFFGQDSKREGKPKTVLHGRK